jgi:two-component system NtrC family sensor kinase
MLAAMMVAEPRNQRAGRDGTPSSKDTVVLYVDDDTTNLRLFEVNFGKDFRLVTTESGERALEIARELGPELGVVVTDERMPVMTGTEFLEKLAEICPGAERIVVTAYTDMAAVERAVNEVKVSGFYYKPWKIDELRRAIGEAVRAWEKQRLMDRLHVEIHRTDRLVAYGLVADRVGHELTQPLTAAGVFADVVGQGLAKLTAHLAPGLGDRADEHAAQLLRALACDVAEARDAIRDSQRIASAMRQHRLVVSNDDVTDLLSAARIVCELFAGRATGTATPVTIDGPDARVRGPLTAWVQLLTALVSCARRERSPRAAEAIRIRWSEAGDAVELRVELDARDARPAPLPVEDPSAPPPESNDLDLDRSLAEGLVEALSGTLALERSDEGVPVAFVVSVGAR